MVSPERLLSKLQGVRIDPGYSNPQSIALDFLVDGYPRWIGWYDLRSREISLYTISPSFTQSDTSPRLKKLLLQQMPPEITAELTAASIRGRYGQPR